MTNQNKDASVNLEEDELQILAPDEPAIGTVAGVGDGDILRTQPATGIDIIQCEDGQLADDQWRRILRSADAVHPGP